MNRIRKIVRDGRSCGWVYCAGILMSSYCTGTKLYITCKLQQDTICINSLISSVIIATTIHHFKTFFALPSPCCHDAFSCVNNCCTYLPCSAVHPALVSGGPLAICKTLRSRH